MYLEKKKILTNRFFKNLSIFKKRVLLKLELS